MKVTFAEGESLLREVNLREISCRLIIKEEAGKQKTLRFRFLTPEVINGQWHFVDEMIEALLRFCQQTRGAERARCEGIIRELKFFRLFPPTGQMRGKRRFRMHFARPRDKEEPTTWFQLAENTGVQGVMDLIKHMTKKEKRLGATSQLLQKAMYREPVLDIPFDPEDYREFRNDYMKIWVAYNRLAIAVGAPRMVKGETDSRLDMIRSKDPEGYKKAMQSLETSEKFIMRSWFRNELENQEDVAERYGPILARAQGIYRKYVEQVKRTKKSPSVTSFPVEFASLVHEFGVQVREDKERKKFLLLGENDIVTQDKEDYMNSLERILASKNVNDMWLELVSLIQALICQSNAIKLVQREAEGIWLALVSSALQEIYRKIRKKMTVPEKRAFILGHFQRYKVLGKRSPAVPFSGRIPALDPIIGDFFQRTGKETGALVYSVLIFKYPTSPRLRNLFAAELEERWKRYLLFYPAWEHLDRSDDKERKHRKALGQRTISLEHPLGKDKDETDKVLTLKDTLESCQESEQAKTQVDFLLEKFCSARERRVLNLRLKGYTQQEIAEIIGREENRLITRQAITKTMIQAKQKIKKEVQGTK